MITPYPHQMRSAGRILEILKQRPAALDASETGTGKTFTALLVAKYLGIQPLVICPKAVITAWHRAGAAIDWSPVDVINIEKLKTGRTQWVKKGPKKLWCWTAPPLVIWDEVHNAGGYGTQNAYMLGCLKGYQTKVIMLSATVADTPLKLQAIGYLLGLHNFKDCYSWCMKFGCYPGKWGGIEFSRGPDRLIFLGRLHDTIFTDRGVRVRIKDIPDFPETAIYAESFDVKIDIDEVNKLYGEGVWSDETPKEKNGLTKMLEARRLTEMAKVPLMATMTEDALEEGNSVVLFVCFRESVKGLRTLLAAQNPVVIWGEQSLTDRNASIDAFQSNQSRVVICTIQAGGVGLSLHDLDGQHPRTAFLTPPLSVVELKQALGRVHRAGGLSKSVQKIVFAAGTVEETACEIVKRKLAQLSVINDGEVAATITEET